MSSSESFASTETVNLDVTDPIGWTSDKAYMQESDYWLGIPGDTRYMLSEDYSLVNVKPIWIQNPKYGNVLVGKISYYIWNAIESSVCLIEATGIDKIQAAINKFEKGKGYLWELKQTLLE
jgi:hypothetical protein